MPLVQTRGAASAQGFGEFAQAAVAANYIEEMFSCFLYTGTGATQTITNNIDLSTKGGLVWAKYRNIVSSHYLVDTVRGASNTLLSNSTTGQFSDTTVTGFSTSGFTVGVGASSSGDTLVSWTFREQPKFFDIVTYSGNSVAGREIAHNLGSTPGCIIVKRLDTADNWPVYHRGVSDSFLKLNTTDANVAANAKYYWGNNTIFIAPTSTVFTVATDSSINQTGGTYVAYLFAHDAGGFGLTGTDNVISCGSFTGNGTTQITTLGYEPQWLLWKRTDASGNWILPDTMRGWDVTGLQNQLYPNTSDAENGAGGTLIPVATGFQQALNTAMAPATYIYIAIRRGPMKVPTVGTNVFSPVARTGTGATATVTSGFPVSSAWISSRTNTVSQGFQVYDRLRGANARLSPPYAQQEYSTPTNELTGFDSNTSVTLGASTPDRLTNFSGETYINYFFQRAPSFMDLVCYTGGSPYNRAHNLTVVPELMIVKCRDTAYNWAVYSSALGNTKYLRLSSTIAAQTDTDIWSSTTPTTTAFYGGPQSDTSGGGALYVAYLFATCAGVSKVGSYTGTGTTLQIDCGFTAGARFVLIKRTDSTGDWYVWDSARGIVAGNDPYLLLNSTAAEVTGTDYVDTYSAGFEISSTAPAAINASAGSFIFLAIA